MFAPPFRFGKPKPFRPPGPSMSTIDWRWLSILHDWETMTEIEAEVKEEDKTEVKVQAMHFETEAMHRGPSIVDHGPKMWQVNR